MRMGIVMVVGLSLTLCIAGLRAETPATRPVLPTTRSAPATASAPATPASAPVLTNEDRALFVEVPSMTLPPDSLIKAYAHFAKLAAAGDAKGLRACCLETVAISDQPRPEGKEYSGTDLNLPFLKKGFIRNVMSVGREGEANFLLRTASTSLWFVQDEKGEWKISKVTDKPIE